MDLKIALCDDSEKEINDIYNKLKNINEDFRIDKFNSGKLLIETEKKYDIVFLDIEMDELNGIKTAENIRKRNISDYIIFLTGYSEFMQEAFKVRAFRYLSKPACLTEIQEALSNIEEEISENCLITINNSGNLTCVPYKDIICFEAFGDGTYIYTKEKVYTTSKPLKKWMSEIEGSFFFQVHKSYIVSYEYVTNIRMYETEMIGLKMGIPISQRKYTKFKKSFFEYLKKKTFHM